MQNKIGFAIWSLHISAVLYILLGVLVLAFPTFLLQDAGSGDAEFDAMFATIFSIVMALVSLALVIGIEVVVWGLGKRKFWAWVAGLCIFALYVPSLFLPLGAFGLWGLLDKGSREAFGVGVQK